MIQLNLLPDVKLEYIKARRTKRFVTLIAVLITGVSIAIMALLFIATNLLQRQHMHHLAADIERDSKSLQQEKDVNKILTVQNQLHVLNDLHAQKPAAGRVGTYLAQVVPTSVTISKLEADFSANSMIFEGSASSLGAVNQFVDTLKFTTFTAGKEKDEAFSNVILASFERTDNAQAGGQDPVTYQITLSFKPVIFDNTRNVQLTVPATVTTQSADRPDPNSLFQDDNGTSGGH